MTLLPDDTHRAVARGRPQTGLTNCRGSLLLLTVILLCLLSVLFLFATNTVLLGTKVRESLLASVETLYIAEAGLSHGQAFCAAHGEEAFATAEETEGEGGTEGSEIEAPFEAWLPFGRGEYRLQAYRLSTDAQPFVLRDSGILLVSTARLQEGEARRRVCLLLDEPPSCRALAWWEP